MSNPPRIPSPYASILFRARLNPHAVAVAYGPHNISYRLFCEHIERFTRKLAELSLPPDTRVAVAGQEGYLKWLAAIALARIGLVSVSLAGGKGEPEFVRADLVLTDGETIAGRRNIKLTDRWYTEPADHLPAVRDALHDPEAPCHMVLSSGTTGMAKKAMLTYGHVRARNRSSTRAYGLNTATRLLITMSFSTISGFMLPLTCWACGGMVILTPPQPNQAPASLLMRTKPNVLFASTSQLSGVVNSLPADFLPVDQLEIFVAGSALPLDLSRKTRLRLSPLLFVLYGSTEAGAVALAHASFADGKPGFTGYVVPTAEVEIVDEQDVVLPYGAPGEVRIRSEGLIDEYLEDTEAENQCFRDGWFYPGDAGSLGEDGSLSIVGRTRELMNFGGAKISPEVVEAALVNVPGIVDMAVFALEKPGSHTFPFVAVVVGKDFNEKLLGQAFATAYRRLPPIRVVQVTSIPRNEMGKVLRLQLAASIQPDTQVEAGARAASRPR